MTSTANLHKPIIFNTLQDKHLYREEKEYEAIKNNIAAISTEMMRKLLIMSIPFFVGLYIS